MELASQFRCNGSNGYLSWLDHALQIRETANTDLEGIDYEFEVCETASELRDRIFERNRGKNRSRLVAGYCWDWKSKKNPTEFDIDLPGSDFRMRWNLDEDGSLWIVMPESVNEVGCIHTCQGLELDYVGVIIGPDFVIRDGVAATDASQRSRNDSSVRGLKKLRKVDPDRARELEDRVVKNTYRTLMTRGQRGCFVFCTDPETQRYFAALQRERITPRTPRAQRHPGLPLQLLEMDAVQPYVNSVPVFDLRIAAGDFSEPQAPGDCDWAALPEPFAPREGLFIAQVVGESMNRRIPNGSWCLFRSDPGGSRNGKTVVVQHHSIQDPDLAGGLTIKRYESVRAEREDGTWRHERIVLRPESDLGGYSEIVLEDDEADELRVLGILVAVLPSTRP
jgi:hypothetical protein